MTATLTVLSGPHAGTRLDIDEAGDEVLVGSDPDCRLALELPGVSPIHARLSFDEAGLTVFDTHSPRGLYVNDTRVQAQSVLRDGDVLWLGKPGDEASVMIQCRLSGAADASPLADLVSPATEPPAVPAGPGPSAEDILFGEPAPPADDLFFIEEPTAPAAAAPPAPSAAPAPPVVASPPAPVATAAVSPSESDLFFVEEPAAAPPAAAKPATPPPAPPPPPVAKAPAAAPPPPRPPTAAASAPTAPARATTPPRPARRRGPTPPPSAAPDRDDDAPAAVPARAVPARAAPAPAPRRSSLPVLPIAGGAAVILLLAVGGLVAMRGRAPAIQSIVPARVGLGQSVTITGEHFAPSRDGNVVQFGVKAGRVVQASATRLQVEIPELPAAPGHDTAVPVVVVVDGRESKPASVGIFEAPRVFGISPSVAMPGEEVVLTGAGWGTAPRVQFGGMAADVLEALPTSLKVRVPGVGDVPGKDFPVTVSAGADTSNPAPFLVGRLPMVVSATPPSAAPGDVVTLSGRGFDPRASANDVRVGGARALVAAASTSEMKIVLPRAGAGEAAVEVHVPGLANVGKATLTVAGSPDPIDFHFVAEPFEDAPGQDRAQLATGLGPAFVLGASPGRSAAERALEAARRLNEAAAVLKGSPDADVRARNLADHPALVLLGKDAALLEVTAEDAAGYDEDWTGLKGRGGPVTPARLALWWEAVARDLVLLLVRGEKPHFAADLAPEGRVLADLHALARKSVATGVPRALIGGARPAQRDALRTVGLRVPPSVQGPAGEAPAEVAGPVLKIDGHWTGTETEAGAVKYVTVTFEGGTGTLTYERALSLTVPLIAVQQARNTVRFTMATGSGLRYFQGRWDGQKLSGTVSSDPAGQAPVGSFELSR